MPTIQVDLAHDCDHLRECQELATRYGLEFRLLQEFGPAGGNPLYEFSGPRSDLEDFIVDFYFTEQDLDYHRSRIPG